MENLKEKIQLVKDYIDAFYVPDVLICNSISQIRPGQTPRLKKSKCSLSLPGGSKSNELNEIQRRVKDNIELSFQETLFKMIDEKGFSDVDVYKRANITKQTFSKIRSNNEYHPDKNTAIVLCIGLMLNIDETLFLLKKAGYTLSNSIKRDLVIKYFIENKEYDLITIDLVLEELKLKPFLKY